MWYVPLAKMLAQKICKTDKEAAVLFINNLFEFLTKVLAKDADIEPLILMGFLKDLYLYERANRDTHCTLSQFARRCVGLLILHFKSGDDFSMYSVDFLPLIKNVEIFKALSKSNQSSSAPISDELYLLLLKQIELESFVSLKYTVTINLNNFAFIFELLYLQIAEQGDVIFSLIADLLPYGRLNREFDAFIFDLAKKINRLSAPMIDDICSRLEHYVSVHDSQSFPRFSANPYYRYGNEVSKVLQQIKQIQLFDPDAILIRLKAIRVVNPDDALVGIIESLEKRYINGSQNAYQF